MFDNNQIIGIGLVGFGFFFMFIGVFMFFDRPLLTMGNLLLIGGICMLLGLKKTYSVIFDKTKWKATTLFLFGIFIVIIGYPTIGIIIEFIGVYGVFGGYLPSILGFLSHIPFIGKFFNASMLSKKKKCFMITNELNNPIYFDLESVDSPTPTKTSILLGPLITSQQIINNTF
ncbi:lipase containing protein [Anaeramoeba ignava]|uniref:Lipase containing protein n=1 Tax=Anaeramoeba ignava TaxID=1746090 RepID=A0A9Q0LVY3_ANAIG|nr:lipase containing protein [Anaeramoeba ignava]